MASASCEWITPLDFVGNGVDAQARAPEAGRGSDAMEASDASLDPTDGAPEAGGDSNPQAPTLSDGLVSWWRAEGNADDSVGPNNGFLQNGVRFVPGKIGKAFQFNGTTADVSISTSTTLNLTNAYTIAFWINLPAWPSQLTYVIEKWLDKEEDKAIDLNPNGTIGFYLYPVIPSTAQLNSATALTLHTWHHFAATYDGVSANVYLDGLLDASEAVAGDVANGTGALAFAHDTARAQYYKKDDGTAAGGADTFFAGELDEVRWYSRALSAAEVAALASGSN